MYALNILIDLEKDFVLKTEQYTDVAEQLRYMKTFIKSLPAANLWLQM